MIDTDALNAAYDALLDAAGEVAADVAPDPGEWNAEQILGHVVLINAATITAACSSVSGAVATYDNRLAQDRWTIDRAITLAGGRAGLINRIRQQASALSIIGAGLCEAELQAPIPTLLISNDSLLVDQPVPLQGLFDGLITNELPGHAEQLLALRSPHAA